jgi:hypothetical protein
MRLSPMKDRPELIAKIKESIEFFNRMSPEEQHEHRAAQKKSWVIGEMMLEHPEMTREEVERIYNSIL